MAQQYNNRMREECREDTLRQMKHDQILMANLQSEDRVENKRAIRRNQIEQREQEMEDSIMKVNI